VTGAPILDDVYAYLECKMLSGVRAGDHTIFVGEVLDSKVFKDKVPLEFRSKDFF
jgi:flavin reductase (DIM6/NTAB) family NADH-FMN oxidoreductase RutF